MNSTDIPNGNKTLSLLPCSDLVTPPLSHYWLEVDPATTALIIISFFEAIIILMLFGVCVHFITLYVSSRLRASRLLWLCGIFPVYSTVSCIGMVVPRSMPISDGVVILRNFKIFRMLVYQIAFVRPLVAYINMVLWVDRWGDFDPSSPWRPFLSTIVIASTLLAIYSVNVIHEAAKLHLYKFRMHIVMAFMQIVLLVYNVQSSLFGLCSGFISCEEQLLPDYAKASLWHHLIVVLECFVMLALAMWFCRPTVNEMFDRYHRVTPNDDSDSRNNPPQEAVICSTLQRFDDDDTQVFCATAL
ncbi:hypothetical protein TTRE_0000540701 [Trichuris trichiura]|uniref:Uncharacterized protein n=1 Tax=Trichuris trichiura TaxID=36087 RepID=A0A077ZEN3_TRITR|nr:hypothetical protein TTRE_0000540701 [Trichuris trichiura]